MTTATTWPVLAEQVRVALDAAIPDALLGVFMDENNPRSVEQKTSPITSPIVERAITALTDDDLLQLLNEHPALLQAEPDYSFVWSRRRAIAAGSDPAQTRPILSDSLRAIVERTLTKHANEHLASRAAGVVA